MNTRTPSLAISRRGASASGFSVDIPVGFDQIIGREPPAPIIIEDLELSRRHARFYHDGDGVWVEDLHSTNGTYVNGDRLVDRRLLRDGDELVFGASRAVFRDGPGAWRSDPEPVGTGNSCSRCGTRNAPERFFCAQCGQEQRPVPVPQADTTEGPEPRLDQLIGPHGEARRGPFEHLMRAGNGGRRVGYSEGLAASTLVFRSLLFLVVVIAVAAAVVLAFTQGSSLSSLGSSR